MRIGPLLLLLAALVGFGAVCPPPPDILPAGCERLASGLVHCPDPGDHGRP